MQAVQYKIVAKAGDFSDGEQNVYLFYPTECWLLKPSYVGSR